MSQTTPPAGEEDNNNNKKIHHCNNNNNNSNNKIRYSSWYPNYSSSLDPNMILGSSLMDLDFTDLDPNSSSWGFDQQIHQIPSSPLFLPSSSSNDFSLWSFTDSSDQRLNSFPIPPSFRSSPDFSRCNNPEPTAEKIEQVEEEDDKKKVPNPNPNPNPYMGMGFTHTENMEVSFLIKEKMTQALRYLQESSEQNHILAQIWAPIRRGSRVVLTTSGQPFVLGPRSNGLNQYRTVSLMYVFAVDGEVDETLGLPGRVYRQKLPEWTPNVQYYTSKEYSRVDHAKHYNVKGTLALPVFEQSGQSCVGVLELIMTSQKINYAPEVDKVCKALEAVNLKSSEILDQPNIQICNEGRQNALAEILEVLTEICETYKLPLAQTWVPCRHRSVLAYGGGVRKSCSSFDGSCMGQVCMSTTDVAFYVVDAHMWGFREACAEHHLQKGQGVAGRAFLSHGLCFGRDISQFCKIEYPLVHYARLFGLAGSFAICLRSKHTGDDDYVLEFFLPPSVVDIVEQQSLLGSILATMNQDLQNLMVASGRTLEEERELMEVIEVGAMDENLLGSHLEPNLSIKPAPPVENVVNGSLLVTQNSLSHSIPNKDVMKTVGAHVENKEPKKTSERKRGKAEKQISLEVLQQYFAGSLKDAAKSLGVCPTTMKRICRQHGISRWPSRKINKVNRSLTKLKRVIESVQGADGAFTLTTLAPPTMPVVVGSMSSPAGVNGSYQQLSPTDRPDEVSELPKPKVNGKTRNRASSHEERNHEQNELASKEGSGSGEGSSGASTSHGSCHNSPGTESNLPNGLYIPNFHEQPSKFTCSELGLLNGYSKADAFIGGLAVSEAGSSKDLRKLCPLATDVNVDEMVGEPSWTNVPYPNRSPRLGAGMTMNMTSSRFAARQDVEMVTIKATFKEDIIRFRFCLASNIVELKEEVAKRLKLEVGTFEIKYLDDDHEWVLIACDSDLQECLELSKTSGTNMIRLLIHDISSNLGSSCESSGGGLEGHNRM